MSNMIEIENYGKVSEETIAEALEAKFGKSKKKFEPISIHGECFEVSVKGNDICISPGRRYFPNGRCLQNAHEVGEFIAALQSAKDFIEKNK